MSGLPCAPDCRCGRHVKTPEHRRRIGMAVALTAEAKGLSMARKAIDYRRYYRAKARVR